MPQLDASTYPGQLFWLFLTFVVLWMALQFWIVPGFEAIFKKRSGHLKSLLNKAEAIQHNIETLEQQSQTRLAHVRKQAEDLIQQVTLDIEQRKEAEHQTAAAWLKSERSVVEKTFQTMQKQAFDDVEQAANVLTTQVIQQLEATLLKPIPPQSQGNEK